MYSPSTYNITMSIYAHGYIMEVKILIRGGDIMGELLDLRLNKDVKLFQIDGISILGNFQNGAVIGLDEEGIDYITSGITNNEYDTKITANQELMEALFELDYYNDNVKNELDAAYLHVTDRCNLHCLGCYSYVEKRNSRSDLSTLDFYHILQALKEVGVKKLVISGGEPFLREDLWDILRYGKEECKIQYITVITNGTLDFKVYEAAIPYMDEVNISIDGYNEESCFIRDEGIMPKVIHTIKNFSQKLNVNLIVTLHKKNIKYMENYRSLALDLGVNYSFSIFTVEPNNKMFQDYILSNDDLILVEKTLMELNGEVTLRDFPVDGFNLVCRRKCEAGNKLISIAADGTVYPCHMLHQNEFALGNALELSLRSIIFNKNNPFQTLTVEEFQNCKSCNYKYLCGGGCRGRSYLYYQSITHRDAYCTMIKNYYSDVMSNIAAMIEVKQ